MQVERVEKMCATGDFWLCWRKVRLGWGGMGE